MARLKVNNEFVDMIGDVEIALTLSAGSLGEIDSRSGGYSTSFNLPLTNKNRRIFGNIDNLNASTEINASRRLDAELFENGVQVKKGFVRVKEFDGEIKANFFTDNTDWIDVIRSRKLNELISLSDFNVFWDEQRIIDTWDANWSWENGYCFPFISYQDKFTGNSFNVNQFPLAVYAKWLFIKIFEEAGFTVKGDLIDNDVSFEHLILPYSGQDYIIENNYIYRGNQVYNYQKNFGQYNSDAYLSKDVENVITPSNSEKVIFPVNMFKGSISNGYQGFQSNDYYDYVAQKWIIQDFIKLDIKLSMGDLALWKNAASVNIIDYSPTEAAMWVYDDLLGTSGVDFLPKIIIRDSSENTYIGKVLDYTTIIGTPSSRFITVLKADIGWITEATAIVALAQTVTSGYEFVNGIPFIKINGVDYYSGVYDLQPNDEVEFYLYNASQAGQSIPTTMLYDYNVKTKVLNQEQGAYVALSSSLPDMSQTDFIKGMLTLHGAYASTNTETKEVTVLRLDTVVDNLSNAIDWSNKIDLTEKPSIDYNSLVNNYAKKNFFVYTIEDTDLDILAYSRQNDIPLGAGVIEIDNDFLEQTKNIVTSIFSYGQNTQTDFGNVLYIPNVAYEVGPKIAYYYTGIECNRLGVFDNILVNGLSSDVVSYTYFHRISTSVTSIVGNDVLAFGEPSGLLDRYYNLFRTILNKPYIVKVDLRLNSLDIQKFNALQPVYIKYFQSYFYVNKINQYKKSGQPVSVELIKIA